VVMTIRLDNYLVTSRCDDSSRRLGQTCRSAAPFGEASHRLAWADAIDVAERGGKVAVAGEPEFECQPTQRSSALSHSLQSDRHPKAQDVSVERHSELTPAEAREMERRRPDRSRQGRQ
jgi:hypothetical protein